jgi:anti-sigma B factor antagonist
MGIDAPVGQATTPAGHWVREDSMEDSRFVSVSRAMTDSGTTVVLGGELDEAAAALVRRALITAIVTGGVVEVDLTAVTFADSAGLRALLDAGRFAEEYHVGYRLLSVPAVVRRVAAAAGVPDLGPALLGEDPSGGALGRSA